MSSNILVIDANILIRAVLGNRVRNYLIEFSEIIGHQIVSIFFLSH